MIYALCFISSLLHLFLVVLLFFLNILSQPHLLYFLVNHVGSSINSHLGIPTNNILFDQIFHRFIKRLDNVIYVRDSANSFFIVSLFLTCGYIIMGILGLLIIMVLYWIWWVLCVWCDFLGCVFKIQLCYLYVVVLLSYMCGCFIIILHHGIWWVVCSLLGDTIEFHGNFFCSYPSSM